MNEKHYERPERRTYFRYTVNFSPKHKAKLIIDDRAFTVLDFSEGGLRFTKDSRTKLDPCVHATLLYADGKTKEIDGEIIWDLGTEAGLRYI